MLLWPQHRGRGVFGGLHKDSLSLYLVIGEIHTNGRNRIARSAAQTRLYLDNLLI